MTTHWLLRHPAIEGVCLVSDAEMIAFWDGGERLPAPVRLWPEVLVPFEQFVAAAKARTGREV